MSCSCSLDRKVEWLEFYVYMIYYWLEYIHSTYFVSCNSEILFSFKSLFVFDCEWNKLFSLLILLGLCIYILHSDLCPKNKNSFISFSNSSWSTIDIWWEQRPTKVKIRDLAGAYWLFYRIIWGPWTDLTHFMDCHELWAKKLFLANRRCQVLLY